MSSATPDLLGVTRGYRLASWIAGRSENPWIDRWVGRFALRLAHARGKPTNAAWPGPIWSKVAFGAPLLSWFVAPVAGARPEAFVDAINMALEHDPSIGVSPDIARLMQRVLNTCVTSARYQTPLCPPALLEPRRATRVLLIDERVSSKGIGAVAVCNSRSTFARMVDAAYAAHPGAEFWLARSGDTGSGRWLSSTDRALPPGMQRAPGHYAL